MDTASESWDKFLDPTSLKRNLIAASVFLAGYEMLEDALTEHLRGFFSDKWTREKGWEPSAAYKTEVVSKNEKDAEALACAKWFRDNGAFDDEDLAILAAVHTHRNSVAHELLSVLCDAGGEVSLVNLRAVYTLTSKVDLWWLKEIEVPLTPDRFGTYSDEEIRQSASLRMLIMDLLIQVAQGDDSRLWSLYETWRQATKKTPGAEPSDRK